MRGLKSGRKCLIALSDRKLEIYPFSFDNKRPFCYFGENSSDVFAKNTGFRKTTALRPRKKGQQRQGPGPLQIQLPIKQLHDQINSSYNEGKAKAIPNPIIIVIRSGIFVWFVNPSIAISYNV